MIAWLESTTSPPPNSKLSVMNFLTGRSPCRVVQISIRSCQSFPATLRRQPESMMIHGLSVFLNVKICCTGGMAICTTPTYHLGLFPLAM